VFARAFNLHGVITEQGCAGPAATRLSAVPLRDNLALQSEVRRFLAKKGSEAYAIAREPLEEDRRSLATGASGDAASTPSATSALAIGGRGSRPMAARRVVQHQATSNKPMKADAA
jgi:hypothetical protein